MTKQMENVPKYKIKAGVLMVRMLEKNRQIQQTLEFIISIVIKLLTDKTSSLLRYDGAEELPFLWTACVNKMVHRCYKLLILSVAVCQLVMADFHDHKPSQ